MIRYIFCCLLGVSIGLVATHAQNSHPYFIGLQPGITVEPFYEDGEFDINLAPLVFETPINSYLDIRLTPIVNYHIGGEEEGISDVGLFIVFPVFLTKNQLVDEPPYGFFLGPVLGFGRNILNEHYTTTVALEPGYLFRTERSFTIALGCQFGASHFNYDSQPNEWMFHWGPKATFGFWLDKNK